MINVYEKTTFAEIKGYVKDFRPTLSAWFIENPHRKICRVEWFDGKIINLHRNNFEDRIEIELAILATR